MKIKKTNPRRKPASQADVKKAKQQAFDVAVKTTWAIMFTVLRDKHGWGAVRLRRLWEQINDLADSVSKGYVKISDLMEVLDEDGYVLDMDDFS